MKSSGFLSIPFRFLIDIFSFKNEFFAEAQRLE